MTCSFCQTDLKITYLTKSDTIACFGASQVKKIRLMKEELIYLRNRKIQSDKFVVASTNFQKTTFQIISLNQKEIDILKKNLTRERNKRKNERIFFSSVILLSLLLWKR